MAHQGALRGHELLERRVDVVKMDIGDEAINAGVDARRFVAVDKPAVADEAREDSEIVETARISRLWLVAPDALEIIALEIELPGLGEALARQVWMLPQQRRAANSARPSSANRTSPNKGHPAGAPPTGRGRARARPKQRRSSGHICG
jgi:hypothetical protein